MAKHGVVRTDLMDGTDVRADLVSVKYFSDDKEAEIDNGNVVKITELLEGEREIFEAVDMTASDKVSDLVLLAAPEVMYDERLRNLDDYFNVAGKAVRGYRINHAGQIFSVTKDALKVSGSADPKKGDKVCVAAGTKLEINGSGTQIGVVHDVETVGRYTYFAIKLN